MKQHGNQQVWQWWHALYQYLPLLRITFLVLLAATADEGARLVTCAALKHCLLLSIDQSDYTTLFPKICLIAANIMLQSRFF